VWSCSGISFSIFWQHLTPLENNGAYYKQLNMNFIYHGLSCPMYWSPLYIALVCKIYGNCCHMSAPRHVNTHTPLTPSVFTTRSNQHLSAGSSLLPVWYKLPVFRCSAMDYSTKILLVKILCVFNVPVAVWSFEKYILKFKFL